MGEVVIGEKFKLGRFIGGGSFHRDVYKGVNIENGEEVAIKLEHVETEDPKLPHEIEIYKRLQGGAGIPRLLWSGVQEDYNIMVIELLGPRLAELLVTCGGKLSMKTVIMLADQLLETVEFMHKQGIVHRDLKPENMLMGIGSKAHQVYIIDSGLAQSYIDPETDKHIPPRIADRFVGTEIYASLFTHERHVQTRRDDLVTLGYVIMYLLRGSLPWQEKFFELEDSECATHEDLFDIKLALYSDLFKSYPSEFAHFLDYCDCLSYAQAPNYNFLRICLLTVFYGEGYRFDFQYDWISSSNDNDKSRTSAETRPRDRVRHHVRKQISKLVELYKIFKADFRDDASSSGPGQRRGSRRGRGSRRKR